MNNLHEHVLVLNKLWTAVNIVLAHDAFVEVCKERALFIDHANSYMTHDFESWADLPVTGEQNAIITTSGRIRVPEIVLLTTYDRVPTCDVKLTRKNLLVRDGHRCAYTGERLTLRTADIEHVVPRAQSGPHSWDNVVISAKGVNRQKGNRTPAQAGMKLLIKPFRPKWSPLFRACVAEPKASWENFLPPITAQKKGMTTQKDKRKRRRSPI